MQANDIDIRLVEKTPNIQRKPERSNALALIMGASILVVIALALMVAFRLGYLKGTQAPRGDIASSSRQAASMAQVSPSLLEIRWNAVGTVEDISATSITVKNAKGSVQKAALNEDTEITTQPSVQVSVSSIKKGNKVIILGSQDRNGKVTANMVRLQ